MVPALLAQQKIIVSTGTKTLQDQLYARDLPRLVQALGLNTHTSILKGRSNYVCHFHLRRHLAEGRFEKPLDGVQLRKIEWFAARSKTGDRSDCLEVEETSDVWAYATSSRDNCLGQDCPDWDQCFVVRARKEAQAADVVVINHHLYCADAALRDEGIAELLPSADVMIFDEAHQLPETCVQFFGTTTSTRQILDWCKDTLVAGLAEAREAAIWPDFLAPVEKATRDLRLAWPGAAPRLAGLAIAEQEDFALALVVVIDAIEAAVDALEPARARGPQLERCAVRAAELLIALSNWNKALQAARTAAVADTNVAQPTELDIDEGPQVCWAQVFGSHISMHLTPLYIGRIFGRRLDEQARQSVLFLSATLAVDGRFDFFKRQLGLKDAPSQLWGSPFDYASNAMLYLPQALGDPNSPDFTVRLLQEAWPLIEINKGRAFILCTTLRAVRKAADWLRIKLASAPFKADLLVQGEISRNQQLERFRESAAPILVGSASFWEGVDVVGDQLSIVIIDKIPFAPPDDPMLQAKVELLKKRGIDPFSTLQVPAAAIAMKQGAGRLIRSESDRGLLMIGDARLSQKSYGKKILRSLPAFHVSQDGSRALAFVQEMQVKRLD